MPIYRVEWADEVEWTEGENYSEKRREVSLLYVQEHCLWLYLAASGKDPSKAHIYEMNEDLGLKLVIKGTIEDDEDRDYPVAKFKKISLNHIIDHDELLQEVAMRVPSGKRIYITRPAWDTTNYDPIQIAYLPLL